MAAVDNNKTNPSTEKPVIGLIMAGGGARAAYQVGVLRAISHMIPAGQKNPFQVICGTSAGAINAAALAAYSLDFHDATRRLHFIWSNFSVDQVFRADTLGMIRTGAHWLITMMMGGLGRYNPQALFDRAPLLDLLKEYLPLNNIDDAIDQGALRALSITCSGYDSGKSVTFFKGVSELEGWNRVRRIGVKSDIRLEHLMASSAIPFLFSAVRINREFFGDGSMRQIAPISPALHLGANRVMVIGVRPREQDTSNARLMTSGHPSIAQIAGHVLDNIFLDALETDVERLQRINKTISLIPANHIKEQGVNLKQVDVHVITPSKDPGELASKHEKQMPAAVRFFLRGAGAHKRKGNSLLSYLLFEKAYCRDMIALGFRDAMCQREEIINFLALNSGK